MSPFIERIGQYSFQDCKSLQEVELPERVTTIGDYAFEGCSNLMSFSCSGLQSIYIRATDVPQGGRGMFTGSFCPIYVPSSSLSKYKSAAYWYDYADRIYAEENIVD